MVASANVYGSLWDQALQGNVLWPSHNIYYALVDSGYTPNLTTDRFWSDVDAHEISGPGYTAGGVLLTGKTHVVTAADSFATTWQATTAYLYGTIIRPATPNGFLYLCAVAGTSGSSPPSFPTEQGQTVTDSGVTWCCIGESIGQWGSNSPAWPVGSSFSAARGVIYDGQTSVDTTSPLIALDTFGSPLAPVNGSATALIQSLGGIGTWFWNTPG